MKKNFFLLIVLCQSYFAQIIFQDRFNTLNLSTFTTPYSIVQYTTVPSAYTEISDGYKNNTGSSLHPNAPFHTDSLKNKGWGIIYNDVLKDTFLLSTSWVDTNKALSRWIFLPVISGISVNTVLHWKAMTPDPVFADGYAVYVTTNTGNPDTTIFTNSNKVFQISDNSTSGGGEKQQWTQRSVSLSNYAGQSIRIAFKNISKQKYQLWIDDITLENLPYAIDAGIENIGNIKYLTVNQPFALKSRIKNAGYQNISVVQLAYSIQGISYNTQSFSISNLSPINTTTLAFTNTLSINTAGMYKVKIWINQVNGQTDQNHFNDTISYYLSVQSNSVTPKILTEQITDALMPDAPANQDTLNILIQQDTNIIAVQIHQQDSLKCNLSGKHSKYFGITENYPVAMLNRTFITSENKNYFFKNELRKNAEKVKTVTSPCNISVSNIIADTIFRTIQFDVNTVFYQNTNGNYRIGAYIIENNIYGNPSDTTINGFNQLSSFYFTPYSNYYLQGYFSNVANAFVLNAYQYKHRFVLNQSLTSIYGDANIIPNNTLAGNIYTKTFSVSVPNSSNNTFRYNFNNLYIVAFVYEHDTLIENRKILNAVLKKVTGNSELVGVQNFPHSNSDILIFPNPASDWLFVRAEQKPVKGKILNIVGKEVLTFDSNLINVSVLPNGIYLLQTEENHLIKKFVIQK